MRDEGIALAQVQRDRPRKEASVAVVGEVLLRELIERECAEQFLPEL